MFVHDENAFYYNGLTPQEWERARQRIVHRAEAARAYALRRERNAAVWELRALDDRTLKDIGINRCEIDWVVDGRDDTRLKDATIAANRSRRRDPAAGTSMTSKPQPSGKPLIKKRAA